MRVSSKPLSFGKWISLEQSKKQIAEAVEGSEFPNAVLSYLSTAFGDKGWEKKFWKTPVSSMAEGFLTFNPDPSLPLLNPPKDKKESDLEYKGRMWNHFSHILANAYGWTLEYIGNLEVNQALGQIQEVLTAEYFEQEFQNHLSEVAYVYNKNTKKSDYKPIPRPYWLRPISKPIQKVRIKRSMLPVGYVIDSSGLGAELGGWNEIIQNNETQKTEPPRNPPTISPPA